MANLQDRVVSFLIATAQEVKEGKWGEGEEMEFDTFREELDEELDGV